MPQELTQQQLQEQKLIQQQRITQQQLLNARVLAMPVAELEQCINTELAENPALERASDDAPIEGYDAGTAFDDTGAADEGDTAENAEREELRDELTTALTSMESDDEVMDREGGRGTEEAYDSAQALGASVSFRDKLLEQVGELTLSNTERSIMEYIIGSLDDDGLLRKDVDELVDELAIYEYIDTTAAVVEHLLHALQTFDPAGVGAHDLQDCLRLQIERMDESRLKRCMLAVVAHHFDAFMHRRWDKIQASLHLNATQVDTLKSAFQRLNPKPGAALGESIGASQQTITPDVIIYTDASGHLRFDLNTRHLPALTIADTFAALEEGYRQTDIRTLPRGERDAMVYVSQNVSRANNFLEALKQRQRTMELTMRAILSLQQRYLLTGDERHLRPMILKDVAQRTGLDISTISRVSNEKYAETQWGIVPLKYFFSAGSATTAGTALSSRAVKQALRDIVAAEDKQHPLSDEALVRALAARGFAMARRTVAKYRDQLGIPTSHLRKN